MAIRYIPALYSLLRVCLRRDTFCQQRQKVSKERRQNQGFGILSAAEVLTVSVPFSHANRNKQTLCFAFASSLRLPPRRALRLCWLSCRRWPLRLPLLRRLGRRPLHAYRRTIRRAGCPQPAALRPLHHCGGVRARRPTTCLVGADASVRPPIFPFQLSLQKRRPFPCPPFNA